MSFKSILPIAILLCSSSVVANEPTPLTTEQLLSEQALSGCGYWTEREVEVCDERTVYVDEPYKQCNYTRTYTTSPNIFPASYSVSLAANGTCQAYITNGAPGYTPHANYSLTSEEIKTRQVAKTERYNCRTESRWVWVPGKPGGYCDAQVAPQQPQAQQ